MAAALLVAIGFAGLSIATPPEVGSFFNCGNCRGPQYCDRLAYSEKDSEKVSAFHEETRELRREIVVKRAELDAVMQQENPDEKKVAMLTGELYDLHVKMKEKADKAFEGSDGPRPGQGCSKCW